MELGEVIGLVCGDAAGSAGKDGAERPSLTWVCALTHCRPRGPLETAAASLANFWV